MLFLLLLCLLFVGIGILFVLDYRRFADNSMELPGRVVAAQRREKQKSSGKAEITYYPVLEYSYGKTFQFMSTTGYTGYLPYRINDIVSILIDKDDPVQARIKGRNSFYAGVMMMVGGAVTALITASFYWDDSNFFSILFSMAIIGFGVSKLRSVFRKFLSKIIAAPPASGITPDGSAWEKSHAPAGIENLLHDLSGISRNGSRAIFATVFLLIGLVGLGGGGYLLQDKVTFLQNASPGTGTVTGIDAVESWNSSRTMTTTTYFPFVEFATPDERVIKFRGDTGSKSFTRYSPGDKLPIYYLPENPDENMIDKGVVINFSHSILLLTFGGILFFTGIILFRK